MRSRRSPRSRRTRARIVEAARQLLDEGAFHESTVEQVAERAGVSRATLYQHFNSRLEIVDAICDTFAESPALLALRESVEAADPGEALEQTIGHTVEFWAAEEGVLRQLYGVAAVDESAADLVARQRADRRGEMKRLAATLRRAGALREGLEAERALDLLLLLTSFEAFRELRRENRSPKRIAEILAASARGLLLR